MPNALRRSGVAAEQAEAHAEAAREFIMAELATRSDLEVTRRELEDVIERQALRITIRLGGMIAIAVAILAGIVKL